MPHSPLPPMPAFEPGWVWLAGAGPGDPCLLTLLAHHALGEADCVVHDALVDDGVLKLTRPGAQLIHAGKRAAGRLPGNPTSLAGSSNSLDRERKSCGSRVVIPSSSDGAARRLSPLYAAGIPFRVIPGITAGIGGLSVAGIPATDRHTNHAITFITGRLAGGDIPDGLDWNALAAPGHALVIYMALARLASIADRLIAAGLASDTPVAVISRATTRHQKVIETTLANAAFDSRGLEAPAIVAIGAFVRLRAGLDWMGAMEGRILDADPLGTGTSREAV